MKIKSYKALSFIIVGALLVAFQNCRPLGIPEASLQKQKLSGGEAYDGKLRPGTYVHEVIKLGCEDLSPNQRHKITIDKDFNSYQTQNLSLNCLEKKTVVSTNQIQMIPNQSDFLVYNGNIFRNKDSILDNHVTELLCHKELEENKFFYFLYNKLNENIIAENLPRAKATESINFRRKLVGESLTYTNSNTKIEVDLSTEVFLGSKKYRGRLMHKDDMSSTHSETINCYAGAGTLPRVYSKKLSSDFFSMMYSETLVKDLNKEKRFFYQVELSKSELKIHLVNLITGKKYSLTLPENSYDKIGQIEWSESRNNQFVVVLAKNSTRSITSDQILNTSFDIKTMVFSIQLDGTIALSDQIQKKTFYYNGSHFVFTHQNSLYWISPTEKNTFEANMYNLTDQKITTIEIDPVKALNGMEVYRHKGFSFGHKLFFRPNSNDVVVIIDAESESIFHKRSRYVYLDFDNKIEKPFGIWGARLNSQVFYWYNKDRFWFAQRDTSDGWAFNLNLYQGQINKDNAVSFHRLLTEVHYNFTDLHKVKNSNEIIATLTPDRAYNTLHTKIYKIKLDDSAQIIKELNFNTNNLWYSFYSPFVNNMLVFWDDIYVGLKFFLTIGNFDDQYVDPEVLEMGELSRGDALPKLVNNWAQKKTFLIKSTPNNSELLLYNYENQKSYFSTIFTNYKIIYRVKDSDRLLLAKSLEGKIIFYLMNLNNFEMIELTKVIAVSSDQRIYNIIALDGENKFIAEVENVNDYTSQFLIFSIDGL